MHALIRNDAGKVLRTLSRALSRRGPGADSPTDSVRREAAGLGTIPADLSARHAADPNINEQVRSPKPPRLSYELKIFGACVVTAIIALVVTLAPFQWTAWTADRADLKTEQMTLGRMIAPEAALAVQRGDAGLLATAGALARGNPHTIDAVWFPASGGHIQLIAPRKGAHGLQPSAFAAPVSQFGARGLVTRVPYFADGRRVGELVMQAHEEEIDRRGFEKIFTAFILATVATLSSALFAKFLVWQSLRPLRDLERGIDNVRRARDFKMHVDVTSNDEFVRLAGNFNAMLTDLNEYDSRLQLNMRELAAARDEAETANRSKSQFLANMSHEIRTPLNGVLGVAGALSRTKLSSSQREMVDIIDTSGRTLEVLVSDLLDFSRIDAGKLELRSEAFDLVRTVTSCSSLFAPNAEKKDLDFRVEIAPQIEGDYLGDAPRIRQILLNLLSNAVKFTTNGSVILSVSGEASDDGALLTFAVRDTGIGFDEETSKRLFQRFEQADGSITRKYGGTGLGLAISRSLAEAMGGTLEATSVPGDGSTFTLTLWCPRADAVATPAEPREVDVDAEAMRVLVAEDHPTNRKVAELLLSSFGVEITFAENGAEAVEAWKSAPFDLVLMDMQMPVMDGLAAIREIRALEGSGGRARTPIWTLSANALPEHAQAAYAAGADGHETKPVTAEKLLAVLMAASSQASEPAPAMMAAA